MVDIFGMTLAFAAGVFCCLKSVQLGLRWQIQAERKQEPTLTVPNPIKEMITQKQKEKQSTIRNDIVSEWLNGAKEGE